MTHAFTLSRLRKLFSIFRVFKSPSLQEELIAEGEAQVRKIIQAQIALAEAKSRVKLECTKLDIITSNIEILKANRGRPLP